MEALIKTLPLSRAMAVPDASIDRTAGLVLCQVTPLKTSRISPVDHLLRTMNLVVVPGGIV
jgi:hypothetical protein